MHQFMRILLGAGGSRCCPGSCRIGRCAAAPPQHTQLCLWCATLSQVSPALQPAGGTARSAARCSGRGRSTHQPHTQPSQPSSLPATYMLRSTLPSIHHDRSWPHALTPLLATCCEPVPERSMPAPPRRRPPAVGITSSSSSAEGGGRKLSVEGSARREVKSSAEKVRAVRCKHRLVLVGRGA